MICLRGDDLRVPTFAFTAKEYRASTVSLGIFVFPVLH
jgi:hypothetical protein